MTRVFVAAGCTLALVGRTKRESSQGIDAIESCLIDAQVVVDRERLDALADAAGIRVVRADWPTNEAHIVEERTSTRPCGQRSLTKLSTCRSSSDTLT